MPVSACVCGGGGRQRATLASLVRSSTLDVTLTRHRTAGGLDREAGYEALTTPNCPGWLLALYAASPHLDCSPTRCCCTGAYPGPALVTSSRYASSFSVGRLSLLLSTLLHSCTGCRAPRRGKIRPRTPTRRGPFPPPTASTRPTSEQAACGSSAFPFLLPLSLRSQLCQPPPIAMLVFVTGAAGFVGTAVVQELLAHNHRVLGLARSKENADKLRALGAEVHEGSLEDEESLKAGAAKADGVRFRSLSAGTRDLVLTPYSQVIHLAFRHGGFNDPAAGFQDGCELDRRAILALAQPLFGTTKPLITTSGTLMVVKQPGGSNLDEPATEDSPVLPLEKRPLPRVSEDMALSLASQGIRASVIRLCPTVHGSGDNHGILSLLAKTARQIGFVPCAREGKGIPPAVVPGVHVRDAAALYRLALESAPAGSILHAVAEERVPFREVMRALAAKVDLELKELGPEELKPMGMLAFFLQAINPTSSQKTRELLGWTPKEVGLLEDLESDVYAFA